MTVTVTTAALLAWAFIISLFLNWYWSRALARTKTGLDQIVRVSSHNSMHHANVEALLVSGILDRAELHKLPPLDSKKLKTIQDIYSAYDMEPYDIPARVTETNDGQPVVYWNCNYVTDLTAYELARLWLARVL